VDEGQLGYALDSAPLNRYRGGAHWVTTGTPPPGYALEGTLGYLVEGQSGSAAQPLYGCLSSGGQFLSLSPGCEGSNTLDVEGWIYPSAPSGLASNAIYRCRQGTDHFAAIDPGCEGQVNEGLLGYALQAPLVPPSPSSPSPPQLPVSTVPTSTTLPLPAGAHHRRVLRVKIVLSWTWSGASTRLVKARFGRLPRGATIRVSCRGRGQACRPRAVAAGTRGLRRLARALDGRVYRAGDRLLVTVSKPGYASERAQIRIRYGRIPAVGLVLSAAG
jgi:hypothetical protein